AIHSPVGIDVARLRLYKRETSSVRGFPATEPIDPRGLLELPCDLLVPAALEGQITGRNADRVKAKVIAEAANGPTTPEADRILDSRGVFVLPDILYNAGGVTVSYFEWVQDLQSFFWDEVEINDRLQKIMSRSFAAVLQTSEQQKVNLRTAAHMLAIKRVADATMTRGIFP